MSTTCSRITPPLIQEDHKVPQPRKCQRSHVADRYLVRTIAFIRSEHCTPENQQFVKDTAPFILSNMINFLPFGPNPQLVGQVQPAGTMCVINKNFFFMDLNYKKGMEAQLLALHKDKNGKKWARIIVEGVTTDKHIKTGFTWVEKANVDVIQSLVLARL